MDAVVAVRVAACDGEEAGDGDRVSIGVAAAEPEGSAGGDGSGGV